jgi:hypothetical protein
MATQHVHLNKMPLDFDITRFDERALLTERGNRVYDINVDFGGGKFMVMTLSAKTEAIALEIIDTFHKQFKPMDLAEFDAFQAKAIEEKKKFYVSVVPEEKSGTHRVTIYKPDRTHKTLNVAFGYTKAGKNGAPARMKGAAATIPIDKAQQQEIKAYLKHPNFLNVKRGRRRVPIPHPAPPGQKRGRSLSRNAAYSSSSRSPSPKKGRFSDVDDHHRFNTGRDKGKEPEVFNRSVSSSSSQEA